MSLFLETIRLQNGRWYHLDYHQARMDQTRRECLGNSEVIPLIDILHIPEDKKKGCFKARVLYGHELEKITITPYSLRSVHSLQMININNIRYSFKYADRSALNRLFHSRIYGDDMLMLRDGYLTDTSYANVALFDGAAWYTPGQPLLAGTTRARLLQEGILQTANIHWRDLPDFKEIRLINAMMDWEEGPSMPIEKVRWEPERF